MRQLYTITDLRNRLRDAQEKMARDKIAMTNELPFPSLVDTEEYLSAYLHAEEILLKTIHKNLADLSWLPVQLNADAELQVENAAAMATWAAEPIRRQPSSFDFGNDFVHIVTRGGLIFGWSDIRTARIARRVAGMFRELSVVIGIVYFGSLLPDAVTERLPVTGIENLESMAHELADWLAQDHRNHLMAAAQENRRAAKTKNSWQDRAPFLHLIQGDVQAPCGAS